MSGYLAIEFSRRLIPACVRLDRVCWPNPADAWGVAEYRRLVRHSKLAAAVLTRDAIAVGFAAFSVDAKEGLATLLRLVIAPECRRCGAATELVTTICENDENVADCTLAQAIVGESWLSAQLFLRSIGGTVERVLPGGDGYLFRWHLGETP